MDGGKVSEGDTGKDRLLHLGDPVRAGDPIVLRHRATGQSLFCDPSVLRAQVWGRVRSVLLQRVSKRVQGRSDR